MRGATSVAAVDGKLVDKFQSTRPMRGATPRNFAHTLFQYLSIHAPHAGRDPAWSCRCLHYPVSIHAPHAGRDAYINSRSWMTLRFNPRAPCGARHSALTIRPSSRAFQSTRPMRGATRRTGYGRAHGDVSIHAPHAGRDLTSLRVRSSAGSFNPRAPCGARRQARRFYSNLSSFNPRAPCGARPL